MDFSKLSDAQLLALKSGDYSSLSNEDLLSLKEQAPPPEAPKEEPSWTGAAKSYASGLGQGAIDLAHMAGRLLPGVGMGAAMAPPETVKGAIEDNVTGEWHKPQGLGENLAYKAGEFTPGGLMGGEEAVGSALSKAANYGGRVVKNALFPAVGSEAGRQVGNQFDSPALSKALELAGGVTGGLTGQALTGTVRKAISPFAGTDPARLAASQVLKNEGVDVMAGQETGSMGLMRKEMQAGGDKYDGILNKQKADFSAAALKKAGFTEPLVTPEATDRYLKDIGSKFDSMAANSNATFTRNDSLKAMMIAHDYENTMEGTAAKSVRNLAQKMFTDGRKQITGEQYKEFRTELGKAEKGANLPSTKMAVGELRRLLDNVMERGIDPKLKGQWAETRRQYKNWMTIQKAVDPTTGMVTPARLQQAATVGGNKRQYLRGASDFTKLGNAGDLLMVKPNSSGTAENAAARLGHVPLIAKLYAGYHAGQWLGGGPIGGAIGAAGAVAIPPAMKAFIMSKAGQDWLRNQALKKTDLTTPYWALPVGASTQK